MPKIKDLSPKMTVLTMERELELPSSLQDQASQILGGMLVGSRELTHGKIRIQGVDERVLFGDVVDYDDGIGIFMGLHGGEYKFRAGNPAGTQITWDGTSLNIVGFIEDGGAAADVNAYATTISGGKITANTITADRMNVGTLSAIAANLGTVTAGSMNAVTITAGTITGTTIKTKSSGVRVQLNADEANIYLYDGGNDQVFLIDDNGTSVGLVSGDNRNIIVGADKDLTLVGDVDALLEATAGTLYLEAGVVIGVLQNMELNNNNLTEVNTIYCTNLDSYNNTHIDAGDDIDMNGYQIFGLNKTSGDSGNIDYNETGRLQVSTHFDPSGTSQYNLGGSSRYWQDVSCVSLTKYEGGSFGFFDGGVEMQDGRIVSDTEALLEMTENPEQLTPYGQTTFDISSLPKCVRRYPKSYVGAEIKKDEDGEWYEMDGVKKVIHKEGEDIFAMMSIMIGAIRELANDVKALKSAG